jgi:hypothetical protein
MTPGLRCRDGMAWFKKGHTSVARPSGAVAKATQRADLALFLAEVPDRRAAANCSRRGSCILRSLRSLLLRGRAATKPGRLLPASFCAILCKRQTPPGAQKRHTCTESTTDDPPNAAPGMNGERATHCFPNTDTRQAPRSRPLVTQVPASSSNAPPHRNLRRPRRLILHFVFVGSAFLRWPVERRKKAMSQP